MLQTLSDSRGRILTEKATVPGEFVSLRARLSVAYEQTFYTRSGDWFAWICVLSLLALVISPVTPAGRSIKSRAAVDVAKRYACIPLFIRARLDRP